MLLCKMLPNMSAYKIDIEKTKYISFLIKGNSWLEKYNQILEKVTNTTKKGFDSELVCDKKYLKTKIKSYDGKFNANFYAKRRFSLYLSISGIGCLCF